MQLSNPPRLILIAGLPGTGKSTVARALVEHYGGLHINSDLLRNAILSMTTLLELRQQQNEELLASARRYWLLLKDYCGRVNI